jgi:hypothetical protein
MASWTSLKAGAIRPDSDHGGWIGPGRLSEDWIGNGRHWSRPGRISETLCIAQLIPTALCCRHQNICNRPKKKVKEHCSRQSRMILLPAHERLGFRRNQDILLRLQKDAPEPATFSEAIACEVCDCVRHAFCSNGLIHGNAFCSTRSIEHKHQLEIFFLCTGRNFFQRSSPLQFSPQHI